MIETLGAPPPPRRRRRRAREAEEGTETPQLPLTRVTAVRAFAPFEGEDDAAAWLDDVVATEEETDAVLEAGIRLLNRALHTHGAASGNPYAQELSPERAASVRVGYGRGEEVAAGEFSAAREIDSRATAASRKRQRAAELRPQERLAAVLGGREELAACETLVPRARADLDAGREREAALQLRVALEALLAELPGAIADSEHEKDIGTLRERRHEAGEAANAALKGNLDGETAVKVRELIEICERVLRRRRVLAE